MPELRRAGDADLSASQLPAITWDKRLASISELRNWAEQVANDSISWYLREKRCKARWSRSLRTLGVILLSLGGAVPLAALTSGKAALGNWGLVLIGLATGCLAYDRFFGHSSAWLRYMSTATELRSQLLDSQVEWAKWMIGLASDDPSLEEESHMLNIIQSFIQAINQTSAVKLDLGCLSSMHDFPSLILGQSYEGTELCVM
jgi:hypothetical protein